MNLIDYTYTLHKAILFEIANKMSPLKEFCIINRTKEKLMRLIGIFSLVALFRMKINAIYSVEWLPCIFIQQTRLNVNYYIF